MTPPDFTQVAEASFICQNRVTQVWGVLEQRTTHYGACWAVNKSTDDSKFFDSLRVVDMNNLWTYMWYINIVSMLKTFMTQYLLPWRWRISSFSQVAHYFPPTFTCLPHQWAPTQSAIRQEHRTDNTQAWCLCRRHCDTVNLLEYERRTNIATCIRILESLARDNNLLIYTLPHPSSTQAYYTSYLLLEKIT